MDDIEKHLMMVAIHKRAGMSKSEWKQLIRGSNWRKMFVSTDELGIGMIQSDWSSVCELSQSTTLILL